MQMSFAELELLSRLSQDSVLVKIDCLLDWRPVRGLLKGLYKREIEDKGGQQPYDSLMMFKAVLLGQWHSLSDPELEQALRVRLDFIAFTHIPLDQLPDASTLCRYRNRLVKADKLSGLLDEINRQLQGHQLMVQKTQGALLDATLIASAARPNRHFSVATDAEQQPVTHEDGSQPGVVEESQSADPDATWVKKGKKSHFGYRSYAVTDEEGYLLGSHTAPAHESEMNHFIPALEAAGIDSARAERVLTDKGSSSRKHRDYLKARQLKCGIMHKAAKNKPLTERQKAANKLIAKRRYRVEQFFGTLKRKFDFARARYLTTAKVNAQMLLKGMYPLGHKCGNLLKAANKITIMAQAVSCA
jgi:IS5 family transposase